MGPPAVPQLETITGPPSPYKEFYGEECDSNIGINYVVDSRTCMSLTWWAV